MSEYVVPLEQLGMADVARVGGKNASLGEMIRHLSGVGVKVPGGFATTAEAFRDFLAQAGLATRIQEALHSLNVEDVEKLAQAGAKIRQWILETPLSSELESAIDLAYQELEGQAGHPIEVAVRSSATAEDLPEASFAGQQETFLNVRGIGEVKRAILHVFASLYNDRAISYRVHHGFAHEAVALSAGIQRMVRTDLSSSGVLFTLDTESGFRDVVLITSSYGLGEMVVQGAVNPDEFFVHKPLLGTGRRPILRRKLGDKQLKMVYGESTGTVVVDTSEEERRHFSLIDSEVQSLADQAVLIEAHYGRPMDIEWGKDGIDGELYILQARPETVKSRSQTGVVRYLLQERGPVLAEGRSIGQKIGTGNACVLNHLREMSRFRTGDVLISDMTDPDWEPIMKRAAAIVTNRGGRTCHASIVARELGIPAVVGCIDATQRIQDGAKVTVSCAEGDAGYVYAGKLLFEVREEAPIEVMPPLPFKLMVNVADPERVFGLHSLPNAGVGLARLEFIINRNIGVHPKALLDYKQLSPELRSEIDAKMVGYSDPIHFYQEKLSEGIGTIAAAFYPKPVIVRLSDFKSNEYANLVGGKQYEPTEENPMIGFRGASRYLAPAFRACFDMECVALRRVREEWGLTNVEVMVPFVRTVGEAAQVSKLLAENGLKRGEHGLRLIMMCEIPSNALLAEEFLEYFDGFSIGSNDLTQLTLGLDRDSALVADRFDERNPAVKALLSRAIQACRAAGKYVGICGQGPSDHPDFAQWLMEQGISTVSLDPDAIVKTWLLLAKSRMG